MTSTALGLILLSVLLHVAWHTMSKSRNPSFGYFLLVTATDSLFLTSLVLLAAPPLGAIPNKVLWCMLFGGLFGALGDVGSSIAYRHANISLAYPLMRALPVLATAVLTGVFHLGKALTLWASIGMGLVFVGCLLLPIKDWRHLRGQKLSRSAVLGILTAAAATTGYTIIDSIGVRTLMEHIGGTTENSLMAAIEYACRREWVITSAMALLVIGNSRERKEWNRELFRHPQPYCSGIFAGLAYVLVLLAMNFVSNVSYIQAFRQLSLPLGVLFGVVFLKEKASVSEVLAVLLMLLGLTLGILC